MDNSKRFGLTSSTLHIIAMVFMVMDHSWATVFTGSLWLTCVGRLAFPIFAFMIVEGFIHTSDVRKYILRMLLFGIVSEIPFDYMVAGIPFYPYHQNVMFTFTLALLGLLLIDRSLRRIGKGVRGTGSEGSLKTSFLREIWAYLQVAVIILVTTLLGFLTIVDYYGVGVLTVYLFYFFRSRRIWSRLLQVIWMYILNAQMLGGLYFPVTVLGIELEIVQQGLAMLALPIIWLYNGEKGITGKAFKYGCYAFYPVHCIILRLISILTKI